MKKLAYIGLALMIMMSMTACGDKSSSEAAVQTDAADEAQQTAEALPSEEPTELMLSSEDFEPFFKAVFSLSEDQFDSLNKNEQIDAAGYFENLKDYKATMETAFGKYFSDDLMDKLKDQNVKLDLDLPKKSQINDYVADASGDVKGVEIKSSRQLGDETLYEVAVTTTNKVMPYNDFAESYVWSDQSGYYVKGTANFAEGLWEVTKHSEEPSYTFADGENVTDHIKLISSFWVSVKPDKSGASFKISGLKQAGNLQVDISDKQKLDNTDYIERVAYYDDASKAEMAVVSKFFKTLMNQPKDTYRYYEKAYGTSFALTQNFWGDINLGDLISLKEDCYKTAFSTNFNPYKNNIVGISYDESKLQMKPSIYSTQLQPAFVVALPIQVLTDNNETLYELYKYYVEMENGKIEAVQFIKMSEITAEQYAEGISAAEEGSEGEAAQEEVTVAPSASPDADQPAESASAQ